MWSKSQSLGLQTANHGPWKSDFQHHMPESILAISTYFGLVNIWLVPEIRHQHVIFYNHYYIYEAYLNHTNLRYRHHWGDGDGPGRLLWWPVHRSGRHDHYCDENCHDLLSACWQERYQHQGWGWPSPCPGLFALQETTHPKIAICSFIIKKEIRSTSTTYLNKKEKETLNFCLPDTKWMF